MIRSYTQLHCLSNFSFLRSASHPEELVQRAHQLGYSGLALTDECSMAGVVKAHCAAKALKLPLLIGSSFKTAAGLQLVILATTKAAYGQLCQLITLCRRRAPKGTYLFEVPWLASLQPDCLLIWRPDLETPLTAEAQQLIALGAQRLWIGVELAQDGLDLTRYHHYQQLHQLTQLPLVACPSVKMHVAGRKPLLDVVTAIRLRRPVQACGFALEPNAQAHLKSLTELTRHYPATLLNATDTLAQRCHFSLSQLRYHYPSEVVPEGFSATTYLKHLVQEGLATRYPRGAPAKVLTLIDKELTLIHALSYETYFLTVFDIVSFARSQGIYCQGRGSAANSAVCFCLGITEVDPNRFSTLFERFISKERNEPPDIDVDFEHERREEVIAFIYKKYGHTRAALVATVITYRLKSALREVGKALGIETTLLDHLTRSLGWWDKGKTLCQRLQEAGFSLDAHLTQLWVSLVETLLTFPRHLSQHVGGFIITQGALSELVPIENAAMPERTVIQWDKNDVEALGLLKVDVLALGMLTMIHRAFDLIKTHYHRHLTMASVPQEDPRVYQLLQSGESIGIFQVESRAQMSMLPRLKPRTFYDLVIEVAIVRPGPIQGKMVHPYLKRRQGQAPVDYPGPEVKRILERTLGVPLFQEQVIELAMLAAGFSAGQADQLRRAMGRWRQRGELERYQQRLEAGLSQRGYAPEFIQRLIAQINGFGEYGFPESHAISFAFLVYLSAWLKCHYPDVFFCALLNSQPMGFYSPAQLIQDARRLGLTVLPIEVGSSHWDHTLCTPTKPNSQHRALRLGMRLIKGLARKEAEKIVFVREKQKQQYAHGFQDIEHLSRSADLSPKTLGILARADALKKLSGNRYQAHWQSRGIEPPRPLFPRSAPEPKITATWSTPTPMEETQADYRYLGLSLKQHPIELLRRDCAQHQHINQVFSQKFSVKKRATPGKTPSLCWRSHQQLYALGQDPAFAAHCTRVATAGLITCRQRPGTAQGLILTIEDETGNTNVIVKPPILARYRQVLLTSSVVGIIGHLEIAGIVMHLIAHHLISFDHLLSDFLLKSRDFH